MPDQNLNCCKDDVEHEKYELGVEQFKGFNSCVQGENGADANKPPSHFYVGLLIAPAPPMPST